MIYKKQISIRHKSTILLLLILAFALALRLVFFTGIGASDSLAYTDLAYNFANLESRSQSELFIASRIGLFLPINFLYSIFGVNEFSSNILILVLSMASIVLIYKFGKLLFNERVGLLSAFLLSFFPLDVVYSTRLLTDLPSAFFVTLSVYFFLKSEKAKSKADINLVFSGLALGVAHLIRETSLFIGLFFLAYAIYHRKIKLKYFLIALGFAIVLSLELFYFFNVAGNPFFRYASVGTEITTIVETDNYGRGSLPISLFHYPYTFFTDRLLGLFYPFIFIAIVYCILNKKKETYHLLLWFIPVLLYISFGSESFTRYVPLPVASRFLYIINIPGMLLLSYFLSQQEQVIRKILMPSIVGLLLVASIGFVYMSEHRFALADEKAAYKYLNSLPQKKVYTDSRTVTIFNYLSGYKSDSFISFNNYDLLKPENTYALDLSQLKDSYIVVNRDLIDFFASSKKGIKFSKEIYNTPQNWILKKSIARKGEKGIEIYYAP